MLYEGSLESIVRSPSLSATLTGGARPIVISPMKISMTRIRRFIILFFCPSTSDNSVVLHYCGRRWVRRHTMISSVLGCIAIVWGRFNCGRISSLNIITLCPGSTRRRSFIQRPISWRCTILTSWPRGAGPSLGWPGVQFYLVVRT